MSYESMLFLFRICIYLIAFVVFIIIVKFGLKKRLDYGRVAIAGFSIGILFSIIAIIIGYIFSPEGEVFQLMIKYPIGLLGGIIAEGIIALVGFFILYAISKPIYNKLRKT